MIEVLELLLLLNDDVMKRNKILQSEGRDDKVLQTQDLFFQSLCL